jgi:hypothetical protein
MKNEDWGRSTVTRGKMRSTREEFNTMILSQYSTSCDSAVNKGWLFDLSSKLPILGSETDLESALRRHQDD